MTVMNDQWLRAWGDNNGVTPYYPKNVQPSSLDVTFSGEVQYPRSILSRQLRRLDNWHSGRVFTPKQLESDLRWHKTQLVDKLTIHRGQFFLVWTAEFTTIPSGYTAQFLLKSTPARWGLGHQLAGWGDDGFSGQWVLEIFNMHPQPLTIHRGEAVGQLIFQQMNAPAVRDYVAKGGQYVGQVAR
jgi:deoxycytidine triphosphate deaminase